MGNKLSRGIEDFINKRRRSQCEYPPTSSSDEDSETGHDIAVHGLMGEDRAYNNWAFRKERHMQDVEVTESNMRSTERHEDTRQIRDDERKQWEEEAAAIRIQAGFRGALARQDITGRKDVQEGALEAGEKKSAEEKKEEKEEEIDIDLTDPEVSKAALKIQSGFRGHMARQEIRKRKDGKPDEPEPAPETKQEEEEIDIDLTDPEVEKAAVKIQAGFKGYKVRKAHTTASTTEADADKTDESAAAAAEPEEEVDIDLTDPEVEKAAVKIQAGFKGYKVRKGLPEKETESDLSKPAEAPAAAEAPKEEGKGQQEEEVDIDLDDPETEKAALKIQAGFRGYKTRKELKTQESEGEAEKAEGKGQQEEEVDIDLDDPETEKAALKIQAGFRGYKTRKELHSEAPAEEQKPAEEAPAETAPAEPAAATQEEEEVDIDLNDPEVEKAAIKIQAGFKGFKTRKEMKETKDADKPADGAEPAATEEKPAEEKPADASEDKPAEEKPAGEEGQGESKGEEEVDIDLNDPEVEKAAIKIQAGFKGFKTRQGLKDKKKDDEKTEGGEATAAAAEGEGTAAEGEGEAAAPEGEKTE